MPVIIEFSRCIGTYSSAKFEFINQIEELMRESDKEEYVLDEAGMYLKVLYLEHLISEARELIKYGESKIALENMVEI